MRSLFGVGVLALAFTPPALRGAEKDDIERSIERGVKALRKLQQENGSWPNKEGGMTSLAGVTLLECDVPPTDKAVQKAAAHVRTEAVSTDEVYAIALAIIFLDRLGDSLDEPLLQALTVRLLSGQIDNGGWNYKTPAVPEAEKNWLKEYYEKALKKKPEPRKPARTVTDLEPFVQQRLRQIRPVAATPLAFVDRSNTQFASLALWVGRRHGVPVDGALALLDAHFRRTQNADGGWGYLMPDAHKPETTPAMTCAGVLGLSVAHGLVLTTGRPLGPNARQNLDPVRDVNLRNALARLALNIDLPPSVKKTPAPKLVKNDIYFLWSLERIMVAMDMERLGGKDWYAWGSEILLANQQDDGRWMAEYGPSGADTCFALLFLRRANLATDLTAMLKHKSDSSLKAGGTLDKDPKKPPVETSKPPSDTIPFRPAVDLRPTFTQPRSARLAESLLKATSAKQGEILTELRDGKGVEYTEALAGAIPQLGGEERRKAREALAERLTRMKPDTLARYLRDDDSEIRRAAALASGTREFKDHAPRLIELLTDADQGVVLAAHTALKAMTGQKIPPTAELWRAWWKQQEKK